MEENKNNTVILIAGKFNTNGKVRHWKSNIEVEVGDYAIVENENGYDLIKVIGILIADERSVPLFAECGYNKLKNVERKIEGLGVKEKTEDIMQIEQIKQNDFTI